MDDDDIAANESSAKVASPPSSQHPTQSSRETHQPILETTLKTLDSLCTTTTWSCVWHIDEDLLTNPSSPPCSLSQLLAAPTPLASSNRLMPSKKVQRQLVDLYYQHNYPLFHTLPKDLFIGYFDQDALTISPLLLYAIFAHAAASVALESDTMADDYFNMTKELLADSLDVPSLSTVVALCLMSLYEPKHGGGACLSHSYSAMAFRMCHQLGPSAAEEPRVTELRKRVVWCCYCLDKITSISVGNPWMMRRQDISMDLPRCLWPNEDQEQMECFVAVIKLMQMAEHTLTPKKYSHQHYTDTQDDRQLASALRLDTELTHWLQSLPLHLQWAPSAPPRNVWTTHLHLLFHMIQQRILLPFASHPALYLRCLTVADPLIHLTQHVANHPTSILSFTLTGTAIKMATSVALLNCTHGDTAVALHARCLLKRSLHSLTTLLQDRSLAGMELFLSRVNEALQRAAAPLLGSENITSSDLLDTIITPHLWQAATPPDPFDFLNSLWTHHMAPSSVDALLYKSHMDDLQSMTKPTFSIPPPNNCRASTDLWSTTTFPQKPSMNIGLGVYASAQQHHNDVLRGRLD